MPLELLDGAWLAVRRAALLRCCARWRAGAPLALLVLALYYFERVEGVRSLRPLFALLLVLGYGVARAAAVRGGARATRSRSGRACPCRCRRRARSTCCSTAGVAGVGLWVWLWPLALLALLSPWAVAAVLPLLALRGAVAPSWLARARCARERGLAAFGQALDDTSGMRGAFLIVELLALFGMIGLFANLYALVSFVAAARRLAARARRGVRVVVPVARQHVRAAAGRRGHAGAARAAARGDLGAGVRHARRAATARICTRRSTL